jgi:biotin operon repressor
MIPMVARRVLETIIDGRWHNLEDLADKLKASTEDVERPVDTLSHLGVLIYDENAGKVRLSPWVLNLSEKGKSEGKKSAVGSIILPPEACVTIQNIVVSNFLDKPVEVGVKVDARLKEISISRVE